MDSFRVEFTRYDNVEWDEFNGTPPDPYVHVYIAPDTLPTGTSTVFSDTAFPTNVGTLAVASAANLIAGVFFDVWESDSPLSDEHVGGLCGFSSAAGQTPLPLSAFTGAPLSVTCLRDASTLQSGFTLSFHLEPL